MALCPEVCPRESASQSARADRLVTNHAATRTVTHWPLSRYERHYRRRLHSLHGSACTGSHTRLALAASVERPASTRASRGGRPAGQRRLALPGNPAGRPAGQRSRTVVRRQRIRCDRGMDHSARRDHRDRRYRVGPMVVVGSAFTAATAVI